MGPEVRWPIAWPKTPTCSVEVSLASTIRIRHWQPPYTTLLRRVHNELVRREKALEGLNGSDTNTVAAGSLTGIQWHAGFPANASVVVYGH